MLLAHFDIAMDYASSSFLMWNFAVVGVRVVFWPAPAIIKQSYLVIISVLLAWSLTKLPEWTTWSVLAAVSVWDLVAVLTPSGPLKGLVEESQRRNEPIPGLVYEGACTACSPRDSAPDSACCPRDSAGCPRDSACCPRDSACSRHVAA
jgi:presenilin 1